MVRLSREQVRQVDRRAIDEYGIPGIILMENAARGAAGVAWRMLGRRQGARVLLLCGGGNNGGDGLAVARHLHNLRARPTILLATDPQRYQGDALANWQIVQKMGLPCEAATAGRISAFDGELIVDAIFGTGLAQEPREPFGELAAAVNASGRPVLAVDVPSGLDCDTGRPLGACIRATQTVTFVAQKKGFGSAESRAWTGRVTVADIGCPRELVEAVRTG